MWAALKDLLSFVLARKKYWLIPILLFLLLLGILIAVTHGSSIGLLIYPLF